MIYLYGYNLTCSLYAHYFSKGIIELKEIEENNNSHTLIYL